MSNEPDGRGRNATALKALNKGGGDMELNKYQSRAMETCMKSCENFEYMCLNLVGEVGEFCGKVAKAVRRDKMRITSNELIYVGVTDEEMQDARRELKKEAGDILWQLSGLCWAMGWSLEDVAQTNLIKLAMRKAAGTISGSGDGVDGSERKAD